MDFDLSEDQIALRDGAAALLDGMCSTVRVRAVAETDSGWDADLWDAMVAQGWLGVAVPEADGGLGLGGVELAVLLEQIGRHVAPVPVLASAVAICALRATGSASLVGELLEGKIKACVAWSRSSRAVRAERSAEVWALTGRCDPVPFSPIADIAIVWAEDADGAALFLVDLRELGRPNAQPAMDLTRPIGWIELNGTSAERIGGADGADALLNMAAMACSAEMLGASSRAMEMAVEYAKERVQFGRPIGSFQAVKHRCADMLVDVEGMRSSSYWAAWCIEAADPDASIAASTAKIWCSDASKRVMASALQVHGGIGFTWEHDLHLFLKRAQLDQLSFGDAVFHRARLAAMLRTKVEAGESVL